MENTDTNPAPGTPPENGGTQTPANTPAEKPQTNGAGNQPFKTFATQEEFDRHSAGILNNAQKKAEKELLALLGLKPDEKDKLAKFKEAYDATLSESEKKAKELEALTAENGKLKATAAEKDAIIAAITKSTGKSADDVMKLVKMAKGLVDENTTIEQALEQVISFSGAKTETPKPTPQGTAPNEPAPQNPEVNPFKKETYNATEQGKIFKADPNKARQLYAEANGGKKAPW